MNTRTTLAMVLIVVVFVFGGACEPIVPQPVEIEGNRLVETDWLQARLGTAKLVIIDARRTDEYIAKHIPGAVSASFSEEEATSRGLNVSYGCGLDFFVDANNPIPFQDGPLEQIQAAVRGFGINQDDTVVVYDAGGNFHAGRFWLTLVQHGFTNIYLLNGGIGKWEADGYATTQDIPTVTPGNFTVSGPDLSPIADTDDVLVGLQDPDTVVVTCLGADWYYGGTMNYTTPGNIPGSLLLPFEYFFNGDRTWKTPEQMQPLLEAYGITPDKKVITYCGGGPLSGAIYYTFKYVLGYPDVQHYAISYLGWIEDSRNLGVYTYGEEYLLRDTDWLNWWAGARMQTLMPFSPVLAVDVRSRTEYRVEHIPFSVNIPMNDTDTVLGRTSAQWARILGENGIDEYIEAVAVDDTIMPQATLFVWLLHYLGHEAVSLASEGLNGWVAAGKTVTDEDTVIAPPLTPIDVAISPTTFVNNVQPDIRLSSPTEATGYSFPRIWIVSSEEEPDDPPSLTYYHIPWTENLTEDGQMLSAWDLYNLYNIEGTTPYFEFVCYSDDVAEATMTWFALRLLGFPRVLVYVPAGTGL
ncbi:MAG: hypothetical protein GXY44_05465 [Phycisphaerales bacterium]|nr:hypothetical protein [Phycisphaerales bacterium]